MQKEVNSTVGRYRADLRSVIASSAVAYGYTLTVWSTGMVLSYAYGPPSSPLVFCYFGGAVLAFALVGVFAFGGVLSGWLGSAPVPEPLRRASWPRCEQCRKFLLLLHTRHYGSRAGATLPAAPSGAVSPGRAQPGT